MTCQWASYARRPQKGRSAKPKGLKVPGEWHNFLKQDPGINDLTRQFRT